MRAARPAIVQDGSDVLLTVRVQPRASRNQIVAIAETISIFLTAPPVEGAANAACRAFLADLLKIAKNRILIVQGERSRNKLLRLRNTNASSVLERLTTQK